MSDVHYLTARVRGQEIFYREAGPSSAPAVVLLHGYPTSSHMFRGLIPVLADRYHVIAPDYLGFGQSAAPPASEFSYTFAALAEITADLLAGLGLERYALYVHDYGAPVGWRLACSHPERVTAIVTQNGNAYLEGLVPGPWAAVLAYAEHPGPETEQSVQIDTSLEVVRSQYLEGTPDQSLISPDNWVHDVTLLRRPGNTEIQLALRRDYASNITSYPRFQEYFRASQVPLLAVWGANDSHFGPDGARAFARDLPDAEVHLLDAGHFALESDLDTIAGYVRGFLGRTL